MTLIDEVHYDWNAGLGDTVKEKWETLHCFLVDLAKRLTGSSISLQSAAELMGVFCMSKWNNPAPLWINGYIQYRGEYLSSFGKEKPCTLWEDNTLAPEELWLFDDKEKIKITVFNLII